ncbi:hypothetical protein NMY22_g11770 [Coprinellus aureogranulatus]|nr:hypothetical protein NMY22_g11770 [Coprinellus aureogranulatus]
MVRMVETLEPSSYLGPVGKDFLQGILAEVPQEAHDNITFQFPSLKRLILGTGGIGRPPTVQQNGKLFMRMISAQRQAFPKLEHLHFLLPIQEVEPYLEHFSQQFDVGVAKIDHGCQTKTYNMFPYIRTLNLLIVGAVTTLPAPPLRSLEYLHLYPIGGRRQPNYMGREERDQHDRQICDTTKSILRQLGQKIYPNVRTVTVWQCPCMKVEDIKRACDETKAEFLQVGIELIYRTTVAWTVDSNGRYTRNSPMTTSD